MRVSFIALWSILDTRGTIYYLSLDLGFVCKAWHRVAITAHTAPVFTYVLDLSYELMICCIVRRFPVEHRERDDAVALVVSSHRKERVHALTPKPAASTL